MCSKVSYCLLACFLFSSERMHEMGKTQVCRRYSKTVHDTHSYRYIENTVICKSHIPVELLINKYVQNTVLHNTVTILSSYKFRPVSQVIIRPIQCPELHKNTHTKALYLYMGQMVFPLLQPHKT